MLPIILACTRGNFGKQIQILMGTFPKQRNREYSAHEFLYFRWRRERPPVLLRIRRRSIEAMENRSDWIRVSPAVDDRGDALTKPD